MGARVKETLPGRAGGGEGTGCKRVPEVIWHPGLISLFGDLVAVSDRDETLPSCSRADQEKKKMSSRILELSKISLLSVYTTVTKFLPRT